MNLYFVSLGCDKNLVDSEHMLARLNLAGYTLVDDETIADAIIVNTCCFIGDAMEESIQTILELARLKEEGALKALVVTGCLAQHYAEEIKKEIPEVDGIVGTNSYDGIVEVLNSTLQGQKTQLLRPLEGLCDDRPGRTLTTGGHYAYLKIAEGCNKRCTYCIIPYLRGNYRSFPMEDIVKEAEDLVKGGVRELILVAQETSVYGMDLYGHKALPELLDRLNAIDELKWIRVLYVYPEEISDEIIDAMARNSKVCHYLDLPIQHCNDGILKSMGRKTSKADLIAIITKLRDRIPDICLRTTVICGFPGETDDEHDELLEFVDQMEFDRLGAFAYSAQEGTPAATFDHQVPEETMQQYVEDVMLLQQEVSADRNQSFVGQCMEVFIEGYMPEDGVYVGRTYRDAPGVDGMVFLTGANRELMSGQIVNARITGAMEYDLTGEIEDEFTE